MSTFHRFEQIEAWQKGRELTRSIRKICKRNNVRRDFSFVDQISSASRSITSNIAEGFESMTNQEFAKFLGYAKRSAGEVLSHLYDALDDQYIERQEFEQLGSEVKHIMRMLANLIRYIQSQPNNKRTYPKN